MTVTYTAQVASCRRFGCFWKLLFRWKGSIYKLLWPNLFVYVVMYSTLSITYRFLLDETQRAIFEKLSLHCQTYGDLIPVSFVLGFYVSIVIKRWWDQYTSIPWPDPLAVLVSAYVQGEDERSRLMRRTIVRYSCLSLTLTLTMMCPTVKKRFPTMEHMVEAGFMLPNEKKIFEKLEGKTVHPKYWLPLVWAASIIAKARKEDKIQSDYALISLIDEVNKFRSGCGSLLNYDWISVPLVYTQVVTLAVFTYFMATLMGNQYLNPRKGYPTHPIDLVVPIFTLLQFFFYMGWLMVAETLVNPFGEDDDDFEVNWLIDRNLQISYLIVDEVHEDHPALVKDQYWEEVFPTELPYTEAAKQYYTEPFLGSTQGIEVPMHQRGVILMPMSIDTEFSMKHMESSQTAALQIKSLLSMKTKSSSFPRVPSKQERFVYDMLRKDMYREYTKTPKSKDEIPVKTDDNPLSAVNKSLARSVISRHDFIDFHEDIFRMSDFSVAESLERSQSSLKSSTTTIRKAKVDSSSHINNLSEANLQENSGNSLHKARGDVKQPKITQSDLSALVYYNEAEQETVFTNPCIRSHWKRSRIDTFLNNKPQKFLDGCMSKYKTKIKDVSANKSETTKLAKQHDENTENLPEYSEVINLDELILLEKEYPRTPQLTDQKLDYNSENLPVDENNVATSDYNPRGKLSSLNTSETTVGQQKDKSAINIKIMIPSQSNDRETDSPRPNNQQNT